MRSPRGFVAAVVFLLALPVSLLYAMVVGAGSEIVVHAMLALGSALMAFAVFDFRTLRWISWAGCMSTGALAAEAPGLKLAFLLPLGWLLLESRKTSALQQRKTAAAVG
jgi:hypothetical protein